MLWLIFALLVILIVLGVPVGFAMGITTLIGLALNGSLSLLPAIAERMYAGTTSFLLLAIPFFIFTGQLMNAAGMTTRLFRFASNLVGHFRGGLGYVNVLSAMIFSGMSGSAVADASALGSIEIKAMTDAGYDKGFAAALTAASNTIGPVIPPSIPFVIYGGLASVSIGALFLAGFVPGAIMGLFLMVAVYIVARRRRFPSSASRASFREILRTFADAIAALGTVIIIVGGIVGGLFTPTEAAVVSSIYAIVLGFFVYRTLHLREIPILIIKTLRSSVQVLFVIATASAFSYMLTYLNIPNQVLSWVTSHDTSPIGVLMLINAVILVLGMFMEGISIMLIAVPLLLPVVQALGINLVHFGVIFVLNIMIGLITPPMGLTLYAVTTVSNVSFTEMVREIVPFFIALLLSLVLVTVLPGIVLAVPHLFSLGR